MVFPRQLLADGALHETGQRRQDVDRWVYLPVVQLTIDEDLALSNIPGEIGNGVGDVYRAAPRAKEASNRHQPFRLYFSTLKG